jgi:hypothetical protein
MRLLKRFTFAAAASLALGAVVAALWARSYRAGDQLMFCHFTAYPDCDLVHEWYLSSAAGGLRLAHHINHFRKGDGSRLPRWKFSTYGSPGYPFFGTRSRIPSRNHLSVWQRAGFELGNSSSGTPPSVIRGVIAPHWFCALLLLITPALWLRYGLPRLRRRQRAARGLCPACGYDLRATPRGNRCPECGAAADAQPPAATATSPADAPDRAGAV